MGYPGITQDLNDALAENIIIMSRVLNINPEFLLPDWTSEEVRKSSRASEFASQLNASSMLLVSIILAGIFIVGIWLYLRHELRQMSDAISEAFRKIEMDEME